MKPSNPRRQKPVTLSESVRRRLDAYALVASAAGAGLLALAASAEAEVVYTPTHQIIRNPGSYNLDLNGDGITDLRIFATTIPTSEGARAFLVASAAGSNQAKGYPWFTSISKVVGWASAVRPGQGIGGSQTRFGYAAATMAVAAVSGGGTASYAAWGNLPLIPYRYLGIKFQIDGQTHYGWARMIVKISKLNIETTLTGYAYETDPNKTIIAGKASGFDDIAEPTGSEPMEAPDPTGAIPVSGSLGRLARGATGLTRGPIALPWRLRNTMRSEAQK